MLVKLLTDEFLEKYPAKPAHMTEIGEFTELRTYSRFLPELGRREHWKETVKRSVEYNVGLEYKHRAEKGLTPINIQKLRKEAEMLYDSMFNLRQFLSGRTLWVGGADTGVAEKFPLSNFNCSFTTIEQWSDLTELFYLLLVGTGVGFKATKKMADNLAPIRNNVTVEHLPYRPKKPENRLENTEVTRLGKGRIQIHVGDSKEGK